MARAGLLPLGAPRWSIGSCVEKKKCAQTISLGHGDSSRSEHIFEDLNDLVPEGIQNELDRLMPLPHQTNTEKQSAYQQMGQVLSANEDQLFSDTHAAKCIKHNDMCPVRDIWQHGQAGQQLRIWVAGSSCVDFSKRGKRSKDSGTSMRPWRIFVALVRKGRPHILLHEITVCKVALTLLKQELGDLYKISSARITPVDLGYPADRPRQFSVCCLRGSVEYSGTWEKFYSIFGRQLSTSGASLFQGDRAYQEEVMRSRARSFGHHYDVGKVPQIEACLSPSAYGRHLRYQQLQPSDCWDDGSFFYDTDQNPEFNSYSGVIPTLCSHGTLVSGSTLEVAGGLQHLAIMGDPVFPHQRAGHPYGCQYQAILDAKVLAESLLKDIAGNSIHEPTLGLLLIFTLGHTKRVIAALVPAVLADPHESSDGELDLD